ncbi:insulinase family protein [Promicromonospora sp. NPDC019610]|uniref:insulinase family protein n=1 Tax=Promicromonospora sp. NPDC019610 TaxID=3364405 RepID=UPI0037973318
MTAVTGHEPVRTLSARRPGRTTAGLVFRVGLADETLATSGITALVVALALRSVERPGLDVSASVGSVVTHVRVGGTAERVRTTLRDLTRALADLPVQHRESETRVLDERETEATGVLAWRYGFRSYGLGPGQQVGLHRTTAADLRAWAADRFAASNAVAWYSGEEEPDLDLALPAGPAAATPFPPPVVPDPVIALPAEAPAGGPRVVWEIVAPDVPALQVLAEVARRALFQRLRQDQGWTYDVSAVTGMLDGRQATLQIAAGLRPETAAEATGEFLDTLGRLRHFVADDDVAAARAHLLMAFDEPHQDAMWLIDDAVLTLLGKPVPSPGERRAALAAVTAADVVSLARGSWESGLLVAPAGSGWAGTTVAQRGTGEPVTGRAFERLDVDATIVVGEEGATLRDGRTRTTVRFDETAALLAHPDGGRLLVALDGARIPFEPTLHDDLDARAVAELVDRHVPEELVVPVPRAAAPERPDKERIKQAGRARADREVEEDGILRTAGAAVAGTGKAVLAFGQLIGVLALGLLLLAATGATLFSGALLLGFVGSLLDGEPDWPTLAVVLPAGLACAGITWLTYRAVIKMGGEDKEQADDAG